MTNNTATHIHKSLKTTKRLDVVDALRGFALLAIVLLHNLEHYNIYHFPEGQPEWLDLLDKGVWDTTFFLLAGKAFSTFSLLFGFSFFIQIHNQEERGYDFRKRFVWRLCVLVLFAQLHSLFYNGDILFLYAVCGLILPLVYKLPNKALLALAILFLLQPFEWYRMIHALSEPGAKTLIGRLFMIYADRNIPVTMEGTLLETIKSNITDGQLYTNLWQIENGRLFQVPALFIFGLLLGKKQYFVQSEQSIRFWKKILPVSTLAFVVIYVSRQLLMPYVAETSEMFKMAYSIAIGSYLNFSFMCVLVSLFVLLWFRKQGYAVQKALIPYGRMSLTNYITQSIIGCSIYYGYGLGLWKSTGATMTILIAFGIFGVQLAFSRYWLSHFRQGPLERLWKYLTWIGAKKR